MAVVLETSLGDITIDLYTEERPRCCLNFLKLCKVKYYNFSLFHSIQRNLVAQTGDPTATGRGGEAVFSKLYGDQAKFFEMEIKPRIKHKKLGTVSMVNNGDDMHGSQFFVTLAADIDYLDGKHTVFGEVAEGFDVLKKFNEVYVDKDNVPYQDVRIYHTVILDDPYDDPSGLAEFIPDRSPEPTQQQLDSGRIRADEEIDDTKGKTVEEVEEMLAAKEAKANAQLLEMVGDLPDVDVAPPENVLFVCKLNPVTTDEDLEIIFSRFGSIKSCEVIKDRKSGESLQYAFIEFEQQKDCESAYFKMDNVLIDDRRIHVDFSQSVSKIKWLGKGRGIMHVKAEKEDKPSYVIKDKGKKDDYSFVFDDEKGDTSKRQKKRKKKHKKKDNSSDTDDDRRDKRRSRQENEQHHRQQSSSPEQRGSSRHEVKDYGPRERSKHHREHLTVASDQKHSYHRKHNQQDKDKEDRERDRHHKTKRDREKHHYEEDRYRDRDSNYYRDKKLRRDSSHSRS